MGCGESAAEDIPRPVQPEKALPPARRKMTIFGKNQPEEPSSADVDVTLPVDAASKTLIREYNVPNFGLVGVAETTIDDIKRRYFIIKRQTAVRRFDELLQAVPSLTEPESLKVYCQLLTFARRGTAFELIDEVDDFKYAYEGILEEEGDLPMNHPKYLGRFDTSVITLPTVTDGKLVFYVKATENSLPWMVESTYPYTRDSKVTYSYLPSL